MKKNQKSLITAAILAVFPFVIFAQSEKNEIDLSKRYFRIDTASYSTNNKFQLEFENDVPMRALKNFVTRFDGANNLHWYSIEYGFAATFIAEGIESNAEFNMKGSWLQTINTYTEENMPADLKDIVKSDYRDFNVIIAYRLETAAAIWYIVKIENKTELKTLQIKDSEITITWDYVRG